MQVRSHIWTLWLQKSRLCGTCYHSYLSLHVLEFFLKKLVAQTGSVLVPQTNLGKTPTWMSSLPLKLMVRCPLGVFACLWHQGQIKVCQHLRNWTRSPFPLRFSEGRVCSLRVFCFWWEWFATLTLVGAWRPAAGAKGCSSHSKTDLVLSDLCQGLLKVSKKYRFLNE